MPERARKAEGDEPLVERRGSVPRREAEGLGTTGAGGGCRRCEEGEGGKEGEEGKEGEKGKEGEEGEKEVTALQLEKDITAGAQLSIFGVSIPSCIFY